MATIRSSTISRWSQDKTGSLIATAGRFGALMSGASPDVVELMARFGEHIGVAFQLADDVLDVTSESAAVGEDSGYRPSRGSANAPGASCAGVDGSGRCRITGSC